MEDAFQSTGIEEAFSPAEIDDDWVHLVQVRPWKGKPEHEKKKKEKKLTESGGRTTAHLK